MHTHLPVIPGSGENPAWQGMSEQTAMLLVAVCIRWGFRPVASPEHTAMLGGCGCCLWLLSQHVWGLSHCALRTTSAKALNIA